MEFTLQNKKGAFVAKAIIVKPESKRPGMILKAGSRMFKDVTRNRKWNECPWIDKSRNDLIVNGDLDDVNEDYYILNRDILFTSPNRAACSMLGYITTKAWHEFISESGLSLDEVYRK